MQPYSQPLTANLDLILSIFPGVEGTIYEHYPNFPNRVNEALREIFGEKVDRINMGVSRRLRMFILTS